MLLMYLFHSLVSFSSGMLNSFLISFSIISAAKGEYFKKEKKKTGYHYEAKNRNSVKFTKATFPLYQLFQGLGTFCGSSCAPPPQKKNKTCGSGSVFLSKYTGTLDIRVCSAKHKVQISVLYSCTKKHDMGHFYIHQQTNFPNLHGSWSFKFLEK